MYISYSTGSAQASEFLQKYNHLQSPELDGFCHGGHNSYSSSIFQYKSYILFFRSLTLRHMNIGTKNANKYPA